MNYMEEVAKMLGVEIGEEFTVHFKYSKEIYTCRLTESGSEVLVDHFDSTVWKMYGWVLSDLLLGNAKITKKPWKPNYGETYWTVNKCGIVHDFKYYGEAYDIMCAKLGNCYRTEEEAKFKADRWKAWFASDERVDGVFNGQRVC